MKLTRGLVAVLALCAGCSSSGSSSTGSSGASSGTAGSSGGTTAGTGGTTGSCHVSFPDTAGEPASSVLATRVACPAHTLPDATEGLVHTADALYALVAQDFAPPTVVKLKGTGCALTVEGPPSFTPQVADQAGRLYGTRYVGNVDNLEEYNPDGGVVASTPLASQAGRIWVSPDGLSMLVGTAIGATITLNRFTRTAPGTPFAVDPSLQIPDGVVDVVSAVLPLDNQHIWVGTAVSDCGDNHLLTELGPTGQVVNRFGSISRQSTLRSFCFIDDIAPCGDGDICVLDGNCKQLSQWHPDGGWVTTEALNTNLDYHRLASRPGGGVDAVTAYDFPPVSYSIFGN